MSFFDYPDVSSARRAMLVRSTAVLSGAAVALLAGRDVLAAQSSEAAAGDVRILNTALGADRSVLGRRARWFLHFQACTLANVVALPLAPCYGRFPS